MEKFIKFKEIVWCSTRGSTSHVGLFFGKADWKTIKRGHEVAFGEPLHARKRIAGLVPVIIGEDFIEITVSEDEKPLLIKL